MELPKAIIFDVGNTLLREVSYDLDRGIVETFKELNITSHFFDNDSLAKQIKGYYTKDLNEFKLNTWLTKLINSQKGKLTIENIELNIWTKTVVLEPYPNVHSTLSNLREHKIRLFALSNTVFSGNVMKHEFSKHDLLNYFENVITSADIGTRKPDRQIFLKTLETINLPYSDICFVGDTFEADILGAESVGLRTIWKCNEQIPKDTSRPHFHNWLDFPISF